MTSDISEGLKASADLKLQLLNDGTVDLAAALADACINTLKAGGKILIAGNGGSAADSQHIAAELVGKFYLDRPALAAIALTTDSSNLTALGNDIGFENVFARQVEALGAEGDVFLGISTSGASANLVNALKAAKAKGLKTAGLLGRGGGAMMGLCDIAIVIPSDDTPRIQEAHITLAHLVCERIEAVMENKN